MCGTKPIVFYYDSSPKTVLSQSGDWSIDASTTNLYSSRDSRKKKYIIGNTLSQRLLNKAIGIPVINRVYNFKNPDGTYPAVPNSVSVQYTNILNTITPDSKVGRTSIVALQGEYINKTGYVKITSQVPTNSKLPVNQITQKVEIYFTN